MNKTELLVKLIALANNNPNENEANLAARKVCKLLVELKVNFISKRTTVPKPPPQKPVTTWNDITRSTELFQQFYEQYMREDRGSFRGGNRGEGWWDIPLDFKTKDPFNYTPPKSESEKPKKSKQEKRPIICSQCGGEYMSGYIGNLFICNNCHWQNYENKRSQTKSK